MALRRLSTSSIQTNGKSSKLWDQTTFQSGMFALATVSLTTATSTISFDNIPSNYTHLQVRAMMRSNGSFAGTLDMWLRFNGDTGSNYSRHVLQGNGTAAAAGGNITETRIPFGNAIPGALSTANTFGVAVIDILDYTSTNKNKTVRGLYGANDNTTNTEYRIQLNSGLWYATPTAITSITLLPEVNDFVQYSNFALYGIKAG